MSEKLEPPEICPLCKQPLKKKSSCLPMAFLWLALLMTVILAFTLVICLTSR
jgi:hypothetical protein